MFLARQLGLLHFYFWKWEKGHLASGEASKPAKPQPSVCMKKKMGVIAVGDLSCKGERKPSVGLICCLRFAAYLGCGKEIVESFPALRLLLLTHVSIINKQEELKLHMQSQNCSTAGVTDMVGWLAQLACWDGQVYTHFRKGRQGKQRAGLALYLKEQLKWQHGRTQAIQDTSGCCQG